MTKAGPARRTVLLALAALLPAGRVLAQQPQDSAGREVMLVSKPCLFQQGEATWDDGFAVLMKAFASVADEANRAGLRTLGRPKAHFTQTDDFGFRFDAMLMLEAPPPVPPDLGNDVRAGQTPEGKTMRFEHRAAYDDIDSTYEAIAAFLEEKGLTAQGRFVEEYLNDPKNSEDPGLEVDVYVFID